MLFEVQESQKLGAISSHEQLLRASTNCQMQTNTFNNLKLIYCTGKAVERKKQIHVGMEVDNRYDKFVVLEWLRKALCSFCVSKCIVEQSNEAADNALREWSRNIVSSSGHVFAGEVLPEGNREENVGIPLQKGR